MFSKVQVIVFAILTSVAFASISQENKCVLPKGDSTCDDGWTPRSIKSRTFCFDCDEFSEPSRRLIQCGDEISTHSGIWKSTKNVCEKAPTPSPTQAPPPTVPPTSNVQRFRDACNSQNDPVNCHKVAYNSKHDEIVMGRGFKMCKFVRKKDIGCVPIKKVIAIAKKLDKRN